MLVSYQPPKEMSAATVHCPCLSSLSISKPPSTTPPLANLQHHQLSTLFFCEECDAIRCDSCVSCEISCYFCPNCLFEVPSASVRGEKNRCARNCFQCPLCLHSLTVAATDPPLDPEASSLTSTVASTGQPPYFLQCSTCKWDSKECGIVFEKPTGLAAQMQRMEDDPADIQAFDSLKSHFEPYLKRNTSNSAPNLASSTILRESTRFNSHYGLSTMSRARPDLRVTKDELNPYKPSVTWTDISNGEENERRKLVTEEEKVDFMRNLGSVGEVAQLDARWTGVWNPPLRAVDLRPLRIPLEAKRTKRCPECRHILIKPEQKSSSTRYKIKLVASNFLPSIELYRRPLASLGSRLSAIGAAGSVGIRRTQRSTISRMVNDDEEPLRPGRTYTYELGFTNPLYDPIHVKVKIARPEGGTFSVNLPCSNFPIAAYAEDWEYDAEDESLEDDLDSIDYDRRKRTQPGLVEKKMNRTTIIMEVMVAKETVGPIRANMLVTYVYQTDDPTVAPLSPTKSPMKKIPGIVHSEDVKSFSFWSMLTLGTVLPRADRSERRSESRSSISYIGSTPASQIFASKA